MKKNRVFIYRADSKKSTYGYKVTCAIYEVVKNIPQYIGECKFNTASTPGADSEVLNCLVNGGVLPESLLKLSITNWRNAGYYCKEVEMFAKIIKI